MPHDVFIGYSWKDLKDAEAIRAYLANAGLSCFLDKTDINDYAKWTEIVPAAIRDCRVYLALMPPNSRASTWVGNELAFATKHNRPRLPVILSPGMHLPDDLDIQLGTIQHIVADPSLEGVLPRIAEATAQVVDRQRHAEEWDDREAVLARATYRHKIDLPATAFGLCEFTNSSGTARIEGAAYVLSSIPNEYVGTHGKSWSMWPDTIPESTCGAGRRMPAGCCGDPGPTGGEARRALGDGTR